MPDRDMFENSLGPNHLLWFDGEYTGLNPDIDVILEIGFIATDFNLSVLDTYSSYVKQEEAVIRELIARNDHWIDKDSEAEEFIRRCSSGEPIEEIDIVLSGIAKKVNEEEVGILAGNSLFTDRSFINTFMPNLASLLHYRMLDVSSFKIYVQSTRGVEFKKLLAHRALSDIEESIEEFRALTQLLEEK